MTTIEVIGNAMMFFGSYCFAKDIIAPLVRSVFYNKKKRKYDQKIIVLEIKIQMDHNARMDKIRNDIGKRKADMANEIQDCKMKLFVEQMKLMNN